jgi:tetratricopeptide (TPR) repeat protein
VRTALLVALVATLSGCSMLGGAEETPSTAEQRELSKVSKLERELEATGDDIALRGQLANHWLRMVKWPGASKEEKLERAQKALGHADKAIELDEDRVEGHYFRALAIGRVLENSFPPDMDLIEPLEAEGLRAKELDPTFDDAGPCRFLAVLYAEAPAWPLGPESAQDDEVIEELFAEAFRLAPLAPENHLAYAEYLAKEGQEGKSNQALKRARELLDKDHDLDSIDRLELEERIRKLMRSARGPAPATTPREG